LARWAAAAVLALSVAGVSYLLLPSGPPLPFGAVVEETGAGLYHADTLARLEGDVEIAVGETIRTAPGQSSLLRLADGSRVEVRGRSELAVERGRRGAILRVDRGEVIVEAAPQGRGRLYVATEECLVSVKGTIFAVSHGTRGSRVSVIEGEVQVDAGGEERLLGAGDRTTTWARHGDAAVAPLGDELAWSRSVDRYLALLDEVTELRRALERDLPRPGLRYSSRLLDLVPDGLAVYAAFPNLAETLVEADRIVQERIAESPILSEWWQSQMGADEARAGLDRLSETLAEAAGFLGDEIVVSATLDAGGDLSPLLLAELTDPAGMRLFLERQAAEHGAGEEIALLGPGDDPAAAPAGRPTVWIGQATLVASPDPAAIAAAVSRLSGGVGPAPSGGLKPHLALAYREGAEILIAADIAQVGRMAAGADAAEGDPAWTASGLASARHLILQQRRIGESTLNDAVLAFDGPRRGVASWLAEPAPLGSLAYISPDAKLAAAVVLREPVAIFDEMLALSVGESGVDPAAKLAEVEAEMGMSPRDDLAAALGGELAFALDGPVVPEPAWKAIVEVYDPGKLVYSLERLVAASNDARRAGGEPEWAWTVEEVGGRTYYGIEAERPIRMTFDGSYLLVAPNRALLDRALRYRQSGYSLESSARFSRLLPGDGRGDFSAILYQDALSLLEPLSGLLSERELTDEQRQAIEALRGQQEPTLAYAYGERSRIVFAARGATDLLTSGLPGMLGLGIQAPAPPAGDAG
ncbi:MAG: FecR family protein, partial [Thermoanaerobaculia bacterium]|nr:FecR family protein [Thermoanaerobaculia bacterium]